MKVGKEALKLKISQKEKMSEDFGPIEKIRKFHSNCIQDDEEEEFETVSINRKNIVLQEKTNNKSDLDSMLDQKKKKKFKLKKDKDGDNDKSLNSFIMLKNMDCLWQQKGNIDQFY